MRKLLWCLLPIPLLMLVAYTALPYAARTLIEQWLGEQGFEDPHVQLSHPGWDRLEIDALSLTQRGPERRITLSTTDVAIDFDPLALLLEHTLNEIRIPRLQLEIVAEKSLEQRFDAAPDTPLDLSRLPPSLLFQYAPSRRLVIGALEIDYQAPRQPQLRASGNLDLTSERLLSRMRLSLEPSSDHSQPLLSPAYLDLDFSASQQLGLSLVQANRQLIRGRGQLITEAPQWGVELEGFLQLGRLYSWLAPLLPTPPFQDLEGELQFALSSRWPTQLPLAPTPLLQALTARLGFSSEASVTAVQLPQQLHSQQLTTRLEGELNLQQGQLSLSLHPQSQLGSREIRHPQLALASLIATLQQPLSATLDLSEPTLDGLALSPLQLTLSPEELVLAPDIPIALTPLTVQLEPTPGLDSIQFRVASDQVQGSWQGRPLPPLAVELQGRWQQDDMNGQLNLHSTAPPLQFKAYWRYLDRFYANWQFTPLQLTAGQDTFSQLLPQWPRELNIVSGELMLEGDLVAASSTQWQLAANASLEDTALIWDDTLTIEQLGADLNLTRSVDGTISSSGQLYSPRLDVGVPLEEIELNYRFTQSVSGTPNLQLAPLQLNLLGGQIQLPALSFNPLAPELHTQLQLQSIELEQILQLYDQPGLAGQAPLHGILPLEINGLNVQVRDGQVSNMAPGWLRYEPGAELRTSAANNPALELALSALSDLQISTLALEVNYAPDGALILQTRLQGHNPQWQQGRPIDLSLNIEENLQQLLRSLQLSERIGDNLRNRLTQ